MITRKPDHYCAYPCVTPPPEDTQMTVPSGLSTRHKNICICRRIPFRDGCNSNDTINNCQRSNRYLRHSNSSRNANYPIIHQLKHEEFAHTQQQLLCKEQSPARFHCNTHCGCNCHTMLKQSRQMMVAHQQQTSQNNCFHVGRQATHQTSPPVTFATFA